MARITLPTGEWVEIRPQTTGDWATEIRFFKAVREKASEDTAEQFEAALSRAQKAISDSSVPAPLDPLTIPAFIKFLREWSRVTEDDALPPESGEPSEMDSPAPGPAPRTARRSRSRSR